MVKITPSGEMVTVHEVPSYMVRVIGGYYIRQLSTSYNQLASTVLGVAVFGEVILTEEIYE